MTKEQKYKSTATICDILSTSEALLETDGTDYDEEPHNSKPAQLRDLMVSDLKQNAPLFETGSGATTDCGLIATPKSSIFQARSKLHH